MSNPRKFCVLVLARPDVTIPISLGALERALDTSRALICAASKNRCDGAKRQMRGRMALTFGLIISPTLRVLQRKTHAVA
jgi:hypothetical protein